MDFSFDKVANVIYLRFSHEDAQSSEEITDGIIVDYGKDKNVISIEILSFTNRKLDLNDLIKMHAEEIIPLIIQYP